MTNAESIGKQIGVGALAGGIKVNRRPEVPLAQELMPPPAKGDLYEQHKGCITAGAAQAVAGLNFYATQHDEARALVDPVLNAHGADRMIAYQRFQEQLHCTSTGALKEALIVLNDADLLDQPWIKSFLPRDPEGKQIRNLLRRDIEGELANRPRPVKHEAVELIDGVTGKQGAAQLEAFSKFMDAVRGASRPVLEAAREELITRMVNDSDRDARLIDKLMLHAVNRELDRIDELPGISLRLGKPIPLLLDKQDYTLLNNRLEGADAGTAARIKSLVDMQ